MTRNSMSLLELSTPYPLSAGIGDNPRAPCDWPALHAEKRPAHKPKSPIGTSLVRFCASLVLWAVPGALVISNGGQPIWGHLLTDPLHQVPSETLALVAALVYVMATGLFVAASAKRIARARPRYVSVCVSLAVAPAILASLAWAFVLSFGVFLGLLLWWFPALA